MLPIIIISLSLLITIWNDSLCNLPNDLNGIVRHVMRHEVSPGPTFY